MPKPILDRVALVSSLVGFVIVLVALAAGRPRVALFTLTVMWMVWMVTASRALSDDRRLPEKLSLGVQVGLQFLVLVLLWVNASDWN